MKRVDAVPSTDESYLSLDTGVGTRASVLTLDGRASVITKDCSIPVNDVTSKVQQENANLKKILFEIFYNHNPLLI